MSQILASGPKRSISTDKYDRVGTTLIEWGITVSENNQDTITAKVNRKLDRKFSQKLQISYPCTSETYHRWNAWPKLQRAVHNPQSTLMESFVLGDQGGDDHLQDIC